MFKSVILIKNIRRNTYLQWNSINKDTWLEFLEWTKDYYRLSLSYYSSNEDNYSDYETAWMIPGRYRHLFGGVGDIYAQIMESNSKSFGVRPPTRWEKTIIIVTAKTINILYNLKNEVKDGKE